MTGVEFVATPRSVVIPPRTDGLAVELSITPLAEGVLKVRCHSIILSNYSTMHHITTQYKTISKTRDNQMKYNDILLS